MLPTKLRSHPEQAAREDEGTGTTRSGAEIAEEMALRLSFRPATAKAFFVAAARPAQRSR
jgi:hypothetical protein